LGDDAARGLRLYFDRSIGKSVPRALREVGVEVAYHTERYPDQPALPDDRWIQDASRADEIVIHKDKRIRYRPEERAAFVRAGARMFLLGGNLNRFDMLRLLMIAWPDMARAVECEPAPFIYRVLASGRLSRLHPSESAAPRLDRP
jgi:hypothetical protein